MRPVKCCSVLLVIVGLHNAQSFRIRERKTTPNGPPKPSDVSDSLKALENSSESNSYQPKSYRIFSQGINLEVAEILDKVESYISRLYQIIHQKSIKEPKSHDDVTDDRISKMIRTMEEIFPQVESRGKREVEEGVDTVADCEEELGGQKVNKINEFIKKVARYGYSSLSTLDEVYALGKVSLASFMRESMAQLGTALSTAAVRMGDKFDARDSDEGKQNRSNDIH